MMPTVEVGGEKVAEVETCVPPVVEGVLLLNQVYEVGVPDPVVKTTDRSGVVPLRQAELSFGCVVMEALGLTVTVTLKVGPLQLKSVPYRGVTV